jgi:hypothetical protein
VSEQETTACPDCGAVYQFLEEQQGKLLHCKCGRYLVAGGINQKTASAPKTPAPVAPTPVPESSQPSFGIKTPTPAPATDSSQPTFGIKASAPAAPTISKPVQVEKPEPAAKSAMAAEQNKFLIYGGVLAAVAVIGLAFLFFRPAKKPNLVPVSQALPAVTPAAAVPAAACTGTPNRLENGTSVAHSMLGHGMGKLEIENATPTDVAVRVTGSASMTIAWVYVQQGQKTTIGEIPLGSQQVLVASGSDWDPQTLTFKCNDVYTAMDKTIDYNDRREDDRTIYTTHKVILGKQQTSTVSKEDYFRGHFGS